MNKMKSYNMKLFLMSFYSFFHINSTFYEKFVDYQENSEDRKTQLNDKIPLSAKKRQIIINIAKLRRTYFSAFKIIFLAVMITFLIFTIIYLSNNNHYCFSFNNLLGTVSISLFAFATLARLDWRKNSLGGKCVHDLLDLYLFRILYLLATVSGLLSYLI